MQLEMTPTTQRRMSADMFFRTRVDSITVITQLRFPIEIIIMGQECQNKNMAQAPPSAAAAKQASPRIQDQEILPIRIQIRARPRRLQAGETHNQTQVKNEYNL